MCEQARSKCILFREADLEAYFSLSSASLRNVSVSDRLWYVIALINALERRTGRCTS